MRSDESFHHSGDSFCISGAPGRLLQTRSREIVRLLMANRPTQEERHDVPPRLVEGVFNCLNALGFEQDLTEGEAYFLREIPGMEGHVIVFPPGRPPLVGIHLDRFDYPRF